MEKIEKLKKKIKVKPKLHKFLKILRIICDVGAYLIALFTILTLSIGGSCSNNKNQVLAYGDYKQPKGLKQSNAYNYISIGDFIYYFQNNSIDNLTSINSLAGVTNGYGISTTSYLGYYASNYMDSYTTFNTMYISNSKGTTSFINDFGTYNSNGSLRFRVSFSSSSYIEIAFYQYLKTGSDNDFYCLYDLMQGTSSGKKGIQANIYGVYASVDNIYFSALYNIISSAMPNIDAIYTQSEYDSGTSEAYTNGYSEGYSYGYDVGYSAGGENGFNGDLVTETIIPSDYDFRKLLADTYYEDYGIFSVNGLNYTHGDVVAYSMAISGGSSWSIGDKTYNALIFTIMSIDPNTTIYNSVEGTSATASSVFGDSYTNLFGMPYVHYGYFDSTNYDTYVDNGWYLASDVNLMAQTDYKLKIIDSMELTSSVNWNNYTWTSLGFRILNDFESDNDLVSVPLYDNVLTFKQLVTLDDTSVQSDNNAMVSIFTMFKQGFNAIGAILGFYILPGMTLGVLLFIPLIATIIFAVIKIIKK